MKPKCMRKVVLVSIKLFIYFQELFASGGVDMVIEYLKKDPAKVHSPLGDHALFLAAIDCIW